MRFSVIYTKLRGYVHKARDAERLLLKAIETYLPGLVGFPSAFILSRSFRLASRAASYSNSPLRHNMVMYESYNGRDFAGNPYALFLHLLYRPEYTHLQHVLVAPSPLHPKVRAFRKHPRVRIVRPDSRPYIRSAESCAYFINNASYKPYLVKREGQIYLYTWHSTLLKKLAADKGSPWEARNVNRALVSADYFISPNRFTTETLLKSHGADGFADATVAEFGYPRNDLTLNADIPSLREKLGLTHGERLVLCAPTWRGEHFAKDTVEETLKWRKRLEELLPREYRVLVKFHTMVYRFLDRKSKKMCIPLGIDINEALAAADILVTDYSGIFFDYLTTGKPILFFSPDRDEYSKAKRGFYLDLDNLPGPVYDNIDDVAGAVVEIGKVQQKYAELYAEFRRRYVAEDDGGASARTIDLVFAGEMDPRVYRRGRRQGRVLFFPGPMNPNGVTTSFIALLSSIDYARWDAAVLLPYDGKNREFQERLDCRAGIFYLGAPDGFTWAEYIAHARFIKHGARSADDLPSAAYARSLTRVFGHKSFNTAVNFHGYQPTDAVRIALGVSASRRVIFLHNDLERDRVIKQPQLRSVFSLYKFYDTLFCVSADSLEANILGMAAYVKKEFGDPLETKMDYMRNMIEPDKIRARADEGFGEGYRSPDPGKCSFITIGRLSPEKNHRRLFEAFASVHYKYAETELYVVGDGRLGSELHRLASSMGLSDSIVFIPFIANPYPLIAACDCFVLASDIEGQPITILEALTLNKPVIATNIAGPRGLLEGGFGKLVEPSATALSQGMIEFIDKGKYMDRQEFNADTYVAEVRKEFERKVLEGIS